MHFKKRTLLSLLFLITFSVAATSAHAQNEPAKGNTGLGIILGSPSGISLKHWNSSNRAVDAGLAWNFAGEDAISVHGDYLWHSWLSAEEGDFAVYYGIGAQALFSNNSTIGARIPIGLTYLFEEAPLDVFVEIAPIFEVIPNTEFEGSGGLGVRFYF